MRAAIKELQQSGFDMKKLSITRHIPLHRCFVVPHTAKAAQIHNEKGR